MASKRLFVPHVSLTVNGNDREDYSGFRVIHQPAGAGDIFHVSFYGVTCDVVMQSHTE
jgi:hypothetical protein